MVSSKFLGWPVLSSNSSVSLPFIGSSESKKRFEDKKMEFKNLFFKLKMAMEGKCLLMNDLQLFLSLSFPEIAAELETAGSIEEVLTIFSCYTSLINVFHIKAIAHYCKLCTAVMHVQKYDNALDQFCKEVFIKELYGQTFMYNSSRFQLPSETIEFTLKSSIEEKSLYDIKEMLRCAFQVMVHHVMLQTISTNGDEIFLSCFAPLRLFGELVRLVQKNEEELAKRGVLSVSIARLVVISKEVVSVLNVCNIILI